MAEELDFYEQWTKRVQQIESAWREFGTSFIENHELVIEELLRFWENYQRASMALKLGGSKLAWWIADRWPKGWLSTELIDEKNPTD